MVRRYDMDNLRWFIVVLVVFHHLACFFNSAGVPMNVSAPGIPALDAVIYFCYPWFMPCMFLLAGAGARYSLCARGTGAFLKERVRKLLIPFLAGVLLLGIPLVCLTFSIMGGSVAEMIAYFPSPAIALFLLALMGMGPQWFLLALLVISLLFLPLRALDRGDRLWDRCGRAGVPVLLALWVPFWAGSQVLNATNRYLLYFLMFLAGYFLFSHEEAARRLERYHVPLLLAALALFAWVLRRWFGRSFADPAFIEDWVVTLFGWLMTLAALACARAWGNRETPFTRFMVRRSFALYQFHYLALSLAVYGVTRYLDVPVWAGYALSLVLTLAVCLGLYEVLSRVPVVRSLFALAPPGHILRSQ